MRLNIPGRQNQFRYALIVKAFFERINESNFPYLFKIDIQSKYVEIAKKLSFIWRAKVVISSLYCSRERLIETCAKTFMSISFVLISREKPEAKFFNADEQKHECFTVNLTFFVQMCVICLEKGISFPRKSFYLTIRA